MSNIWFTSDTHFNQLRTLQLSKRPFDNVSEMNAIMINRWNKIVKESDVIYHLGDFGDFEYIKQLNGNVILICGNYENNYIDNNMAYDEYRFKEYLISLGFKDVWFNDGYYNNNSNLCGIKMTHEPINCENDRFNLFGHIHKLCMVKEFGLNVGVDCHDFKPINEETVVFYKNAIENYYDENVFINKVN